MQKFNRILFPIDFSSRCVDAAPYVGGIARRFSSEVILLNVRDSERYVESDLYLAGSVDQPANGHMRQERDTALAEFGQAEFQGLPVRRLVVPGEPADCIVKCAEEQHADLIAMPTHGHSRFRTLLLGSVTSQVLHDARCPVWTTSHCELLPAEADREIRTLLCALDLTAETVPVIQSAAEIAKSFGAELRLIHAIRPTELQPNGAMKNALFQRFLLDAATERISDLQREFHTNFEVSILFGTVPSVLRQAVLDFSAQLLTIGRGHIGKPLGRLRTHVAAIIRESPCPVLSF
jgi:nucleotide-binding universal stress UspA family protein